MRGPFRRIACTTLIVTLLAGSAWSQAPPESPTIFSFLGFKGLRRLGGAVRNRRGNHPALEKKPPVLPLADPANLESPDPAIKAAAEVKQQEDLKAQKIKAVKYLLKIGCACYDTDGKITEAIVEKTKDCTEDVRLATVEAIHEAAEGPCCNNCGSTCCCNEEVIKQLADMAYGRDDKGCYKEPSQRVREAAEEALVACCPDESPVVEITEEEPDEPVQPPQREGVREGETLEPPEGAQEVDRFQPTPPAQDAPLTIHLRKGESANSPVIAQIRDRATVQQGPVAGAQARRSAQTASGKIVHVDANRRAAHVHLQDRGLVLAQGSIVLAQATLPDGSRPVGRFRVYESFRGSANVQALDSRSLLALRQGAMVTHVTPPTRRSKVARVDSSNSSYAPQPPARQVSSRRTARDNHSTHRGAGRQARPTSLKQLLSSTWEKPVK